LNPARRAEMGGIRVRASLRLGMGARRGEESSTVKSYAAVLAGRVLIASRGCIKHNACAKFLGGSARKRFTLEALAEGMKRGAQYRPASRLLRQIISQE
jgi:hypothetical protein